MRAIAKEAHRPGLTLRIWNTAIAYMRFDTGEVLATRRQLAEDADTLPRHVSTAMSDLERIGTILRIRRGRRVTYFVNPHIGSGIEVDAILAFSRKAPKLKQVANNPELRELAE